MAKLFSRSIILLTFLGFLNAGCSDHDPESETQQVETGDVSLSPPSLYQFSVSLKGLNAQTIEEFGIVYSVQYYDVLKNYATTPELGPSKIVFSFDGSKAVQTKGVAAPASGYFKLFYRAYAKLNNGSVLYGNVKDFQEDKSGNAILEAVGKPNLNKPYNAGVILLAQGSKPIKQFGVVYSYTTAAGQTINPVPTLADKSTKFSYDKVQIPVGGSGTGFRLDNIADESLNEIYIRSFVEYTDGTIFYGRYTGHNKK